MVTLCLLPGSREMNAGVHLSSSGFPILTQSGRQPTLLPPHSLWVLFFPLQSNLPGNILIYRRRVSVLLFRWRWPWTWDPPDSTTNMLGLETCTTYTTMLNVCRPGDKPKALCTVGKHLANGSHPSHDDNFPHKSPQHPNWILYCWVPHTCRGSTKYTLALTSSLSSLSVCINLRPLAVLRIWAFKIYWRLMLSIFFSCFFLFENRSVLQIID